MAATGTTTSAEKGRRIVGAERQTLAKDLVKRYTSGESIRALASPRAGPTASCTGSSPSPGCSCGSVAVRAGARRRDLPLFSSRR